MHIVLGVLVFIEQLKKKEGIIRGYLQEAHG